jgi:hypothetical protein
MLTPMQEAVINRQEGRTMVDVLRSAWALSWTELLDRWILRKNLWVGGWSYLSPPDFLRVLYKYNVLIAAAAWLLAIRRTTRRERLLLEDGNKTASLAVLVAAALAGLTFHAATAHLVLGAIPTNPWYAAVTYPWLLCLHYQGLRWLPTTWLPRALALELVAIFAFAESSGVLLKMVPRYTGESWGAVAMDRLNALHLPGHGATITIPALIVAALLLALAIAVWASAARSASATPPTS